MIVQMVIKNELGEFHSEKMNITSDQYLEMVDISKKFYVDENGFEMWLEDGFMVIPPIITQKSILLINIIEYDKEEKGNDEK
jgi:hypothetical protein